MRLLAAAAVVLALAGCGAEPRTVVEPEARAWTGCAAFTTQPDAQRRWERDDRPSGADGDGDGRVCEQLPPASPAVTENCQRPERVVPISLSATRYPNVVAHAREAIAAGWPAVMTLNRPGAEARRARLLRDHPTREGHDRDEYPMAVGRSQWRAHVAHVPAAENRGAGSVIGIKLRRYCDGVRFSLVGY